jgi:hypothetical protein
MPLETVHLQAQHGQAQAFLQSQAVCDLRENTALIADFIQYSVYSVAFSAQKQIRAVPPSLLHRCSVAPLRDFRMVSTD